MTIFAETFATEYELTATVGDFTITAKTEYDDCMSQPWNEECGHGPVRSLSRYSDRKAPSEMLLGEGWAYDFAEACKIALRDGWGIAGGKMEGESAKAYAARCAMADFKHLQAWCNDDWHYCVLVVTVHCEGVEMAFESLGGMYSGDDDYLTETANELAETALEAAKVEAERLAKRFAAIAA